MDRKFFLFGKDLVIIHDQKDFINPQNIRNFTKK